MSLEELDEDDRAVRRLDEILHAMVDPMVEELQGKRRRRLEAAEDALRRCIEINAGRLLSGQELVLLELEVQVEPDGAAARVASAPALLHVLPIYLEDADWEGDDDEDRRVRMRFALELARWSGEYPEFEGVEGVEVRAEVMAAWRAARWRLRHDQHERKLAEMDPVKRAWLEAELQSSVALSRRQQAPGSGPAEG